MMESEKRAAEMTSALKDNGGRLTPQRMAVVKILAETSTHPSVEEIYEKLQVDFPATSLATVYKTVTLLKELGEVLELGFGAGRNHYDGLHPMPHPHIVCTGCEKIVDAEVSAMGKLSRKLEKSSGYVINSHRLDFFGHCPDCVEGTS